MNLNSAMKNWVDILATPGEVFDRVLGSTRINPFHLLLGWLIPSIAGAGSLLLLGKNSEILLSVKMAPNPSLEQSVGSLAIFLAAALTPIATAVLIWIVSTVCLSSRVPFGRALEISCLTQSIVVLNILVTFFLVVITANLAAKPDLNFLLDEARNPRSGLSFFHLIDLWTLSVLAIGLSKLSGVALAKTVFWIVGGWFALKMILAF